MRATLAVLLAATSIVAGTPAQAEVPDKDRLLSSLQSRTSNRLPIG